MPGDWPFAVRAGVESVLLSWLAIVLPCVAVFLATSSLDAAAALSVGEALRTGTGLWGLGLGGSLGSATNPDGVLGLPLLGATALQAFLTLAMVRRATLSGPSAGAWCVLSAMATSLVAVLAGSPAGSRTAPAIAGTGVLTAVVTFWHLQSSGRGWAGLTAWWGRCPGWVRSAARMARETIIVLMALGVVVLAAAVVGGGGRMMRLHDTLSGGGFLASAGLVALQVGWAPTVLVWAVSWLLGPGFGVGAGSVFSPNQVVAGAVPSVPLLGLLPTAGVGSVGRYLPVVVVVAAMVVAWRCRAALRELSPGGAVGAAVAAAVTIAAGVFLACLAASGPVGPGRMTQVGPHTLMTTAAAALETGVGLVSVSILTHPAIRRLVARDAPGTDQTAETGDEAAREHVEAESARGPRAGHHARRQTVSADEAQHENHQKAWDSDAVSWRASALVDEREGSRREESRREESRREEGKPTRAGRAGARGAAPSWPPRRPRGRRVADPDQDHGTGQESGRP